MGELAFAVINGEEWVDDQARDLIKNVGDCASAHKIQISSVLDLGAHVGFVAVRLAKLGCRVVAVEASPCTMSLLIQNIKDKDVIPYVIPIGAAISGHRTGIHPMFMVNGLMAASGLNNRTNMPFNSFVACVGLTDILNKFACFDFIKFDVEGEEHSIFSTLPLGVLDGVKLLAVELHRVDDPIFSEPGTICIDIEQKIAEHGFVKTEYPTLWIASKYRG